MKITMQHYDDIITAESPIENVHDFYDFFKRIFLATGILAQFGGSNLIDAIEEGGMEGMQNTQRMKWLMERGFSINGLEATLYGFEGVKELDEAMEEEND